MNREKSVKRIVNRKRQGIFLIRPRGFSTDIVYKIIAKENTLYFCKVGGQFYDIGENASEFNEENIEEKFKEGRHNFKIPINEIASIKVNQKKSPWTGAIPNNGSIILTKGALKHKFIVHPIQEMARVIDYLENTAGISPEIFINKPDRKNGKSQFRLIKRNPEYKLAFKITKVTNTLGYILGFWALFYPRPYNLAVILNMILPVIGFIIYIRFKDYVEFDEKKGKKQPNVATTVLFPSLALSLRAMIDLNIIYSVLIWLYVSIAALVIFLIVIARTEEYKKKKRILIYVLAAAFLYSYGTVAVSNCIFDYSTPVKYTSLVVDKHIDSGKHTSYYLTLEPWGPFTKDKDIDVGKQLYTSTEKGSRINLYLKKGVLNIKWFIPTSQSQ